MIFSSGVLTLVAFGAMIFIHELGHFLAAKRVGVRVEKFYLGFDFWGLKLLKFNYKGTEYGIGVFPLGGYVKMAGQEDFGKANLQGKPDEFTSKTVWERAQILVAGVVFNFISAFLFSALALYMGYRLVAPVVGEVDTGSAAWSAGLKTGDKVISYDGYPISSFDSLVTEVALGGAAHTVDIVVEREGHTLTIPLKPKLELMDFPSIGVERPLSMQVMGVIENSAAEKAGIKPGDVIRKIQGESLLNWNDISPKVNRLAHAGTHEQNVELERAGQKMTVTIKPEVQKAPLLGFRPSLGRQVQKVQPQSPLALAGVEAGMNLVSVNGIEVNDIVSVDEKQWDDASELSLVFSTTDQPLKVTFKGTWDELSVMMFFGYVEKIEKVVVSRVEKNSEAELMGLKAGDHITALHVEGQNSMVAPKWLDLAKAISAALGKKVELDVQRGTQMLTLKGEVREKETEHYSLGLIPDALAAQADFSTVLILPFSMLRQTYKGLLSLVTGKVALKNISGTVGILKATYMVASVGLPHLFYLMALLSVNLAFLNILPIPVLDGGHLLFCLVEWIKGSPVNENIMEKIQYVGFAILMSLFVFSTWNDLTQHVF